MNGKEIAPGEIFSFNDTVGPRTPGRGFEKAIIFVRGAKVMETGGGICQLSTTIYNAAMMANLEIVERHKHERAVDYAKNGNDATVAFGSADMRFKNTLAKPIILNAELAEDGVYVNLSKQ